MMQAHHGHKSAVHCRCSELANEAAAARDIAGCWVKEKSSKESDISENLQP